MLKTKIITIILLISAACLLTGCSISADGHDFSIDVGNKEEQHSSDDVVLDDVTATRAEITDNVGTLTIGYGDSNKVEIEVDCTAKGRNEDDLSDILNVIKVKTEVNNNELQVSVVNKDTDENIWEWLEDEYHNMGNKPDLSVDLDIKLPVSIQDFDVTSNVGDINLNSLTGIFNINGNVGSVDMSDVLFTGDSDIRVDVGDISCSLNEDVKDAANISLTSNIGNIELDAHSLSYTSDNTGGDGDNFVGTSKTINVEDLYNIEAKIDVGKLNLR